MNNLNNGVFSSPKVGRYDTKRPLTVHFRILSKLYELLGHIEVFIEGIASNGAAIYDFIDTDTGLTNERITPNGQFTLIVNKGKIVGEGSGIFLTSLGTPAMSTKVQKLLTVNEPRCLIGVMPDLPLNKEWRLEIRTRYSGSQNELKELRIIPYDFILRT
ncbi:MAG: DUF4469 domain-containing protein [Spirochaetaceae bacterium]|nr:DUF4469 domain-containing protein [Spirochaetaceae bacterium]